MQVIANAKEPCANPSKEDAVLWHVELVVMLYLTSSTTLFRASSIYILLATTFVDDVICVMPKARGTMSKLKMRINPITVIRASPFVFNVLSPTLHQILLNPNLSFLESVLK